MVSETSLLIQSGIATALCNLDSDGRDEHSAAKRTEGWTEVWGDDTPMDKPMDDPTEECWKIEDAAVHRLSFQDASSALFPDIPIKIVQYRPAWLEQLVLRIADIPHVVINSPYSCHESTGPLPLLQDYHRFPGSSTSSESPVLVGRHHPQLHMASSLGLDFDDDGEAIMPSNDQNDSTSIAAPKENAILEYLKTRRSVDLDAHLTSSGDENETKSKKALAKLMSMLITNNLQKNLMILRYEDRDAWEQVYRKQCLQASRIKPSEADSLQVPNSDGFPTIRGLYQAWSERVMARKALRVGGRKRVAVEEAKREAIKAYEILEHQLKQRQLETHYLLGTTKPAMVDAILWAHLAEALCDVNLVVALASFPLLVKYFQSIYDTFFKASKAESSEKESSWKLWNTRQNHFNVFQQIPLEGDMRKREKPQKLKHALELMQTLSVQEHDLFEVLQVGKEARAQENSALGRKLPTRVPATVPTSSSRPASSEPESSALEKARRQQKKHDEYWVSMVAGLAILSGVSTLAKMFSEDR